MNTKTKKLIIFDMDGTLVNSSLTIANAINYVREHLGLHPLESDYILSKVNDPTINPAKVFYHESRFRPLHERLFGEYYTQNHDRELVLYEGIASLLQDLKDAGKRLGVATNAYRNATIESLTHLGILSLFDAIVCYDDVPQGKPAPDMLYKIIEACDTTKEASLFIGDGPRDKMAAKRAGIEYIMVDWGFSEHTDAVRSVDALRGMLLAEDTSHRKRSASVSQISVSS